EARDPRSAGRGNRELASPTRFLATGGPGRPRRRPRARRGRSRAGASRPRTDVRAAARQPADRVLRDHGHAAVSAEPRPKVAVIVFPGSNDDRDAALALEALGAESMLVWHA